MIGKRRMAILWIVIVIIVILTLTLFFVRWGSPFHLFTWGLPWEQEKAIEAGQAYVDSNFDEPMEVISANRFLRGDYNVTDLEYRHHAILSGLSRVKICVIITSPVIKVWG